MPRRFVSWNVNGIRSCVRKGFVEWLADARADVIGLQETRCAHDELPDVVRALHGFEYGSWVAARTKRGYSGVALLSRRAPLEVTTELGEERFDREGRFVLALFGDLLVANVYFPKGSGTLRDNSRVPYKLDFTKRVFEVLDTARRRHRLPAVLMGDLNIAPQPIDLARPRGNEQTSGFLPEERELLARVVGRRWVDSFRHLHPDAVKYSWWSNRTGVRERNVGWRIDHVLVSRDLAPRLRRAFVWDHVRGSDHCPVGIDLAGASPPATRRVVARAQSTRPFSAS